jgi:ketosteroid isomerase-like protein
MRVIRSPAMSNRAPWFDVEPPLRHAGIDAKLANWAKAFAFFQDVKYEFRDLTVTADENVAFAHGFGRLHGTTTRSQCRSTSPPARR